MFQRSVVFFELLIYDGCGIFSTEATPLIKDTSIKFI